MAGTPPIAVLLRPKFAYPQYNVNKAINQEAHVVDGSEPSGAEQQAAM